MSIDTAIPAATEPRWFLAGLVNILLRGEETDGRVDMMEHAVPPGDEPPLHVHHDQEETFYVLEGEVTLFVGGAEPRTLRPGEFALGSRGVPHIYRAGDAGARFIVQSSPAGFAAFVEEMSVPADAPVLPEHAGPPTPEQAEHLATVAGAHGIEILGPPGARP
jgi:quercetin dioxygenase-like cupin family protein